jgi:hypothetical protein
MHMKSKLIKPTSAKVEEGQNTLAKKRQTMIYKTLHRKLKTKQHKPH